MGSAGVPRLSCRALLFSCLLALSGLLLLSPGAGALELVVCGQAPEGSPEAVENCNAPSGVAADREEGLLFVADNGNQQVDAFDAEGNHIDSLSLGVSLGDIAVDNAVGPIPPFHDIYVYDATNDRVIKLRLVAGSLEAIDETIGEGQFANQAKLALGPGGVIHVADNIGGGNRRVQKFDHEGNETFECASTEAGKLEPEGGHGGNLNGFAVDSTGDFYLSNSGGAGVRKYDAECALLGARHSFEGSTSFSNSNLAVDAAGNLFVRDAAGVGGTTAIYAYTPAGAPFRVLYGKGTLQQFASSIAPLDGGPPGGTVEDEDDLVATEGLGARRVVRFGFEPPGPVLNPDPQFTEAPEELIKNTSATLQTRINPEGEATEFRFQYVEDASYQEDIGEGGDGFGEASESEVAPLVPGGTPDFVEPLFRDTQAQIEVGCPDPENPPQPECLKPETLYHFRAVGTNADGEDTGPEATFQTKPPFVILDTWSSRVGIDVARLHARVNPLGIPTEGHFDYVEEALCLQDIAKAEEEALEDPESHCFDRAEQTDPVDFGEGEAFQARASQLSGLEPGTAYVYRAVVENAFEQDDQSEAHGLVTFARPAAHGSCPNDDVRTGAAARLPDCRAWEMVSPVDKEGGEILVQDPDRAIGGESPELFRSAAEVPAAGPGITYSSNRAFGEVAGAPFIPQYLARRGPGGWRSEGISPPREGEVFSGLAFLQNQYRTFSEDLTVAWLRTEADPPLDEGAIPGFSGLYRRENATGRYEALCPVEPPNRETDEYPLSLAAVSADGELAVIQANDKLTDNAAETDRLQLYACGDRDADGETSDELPTLVSVLPGGEANPEHSGLGTTETPNTHRNSSTHNAISADGSRIYWTDRGASIQGPGRLFIRENPLGEGPECTGPGTACTREVSEAVGEPGDASEAIFWTASPDGSGAIFSFSAGALAGNLYRFDATVDPEAENPTELLATGVSGLAGWSEDAERLYAVSSADLDEGGPAIGGGPNLYLLEAGEGPVLIRPLPSGTSLDVCHVDIHLSQHRCARTTPDGSHLLFLSADPLTGYDSTDVSSPAPCGEPEARCDAQAFLYDAAADDLHCVSCNPTGSRPRGRALPEGALDPTWFAARIPGNWDSEHGARALSEDGRRVFFESYDALSPTDTNGALDVYQWEEAGVGSCSEARPEFSPQAGGCIDLISSGRSPRSSWFADASADGKDVFFRTAESLWPEDPGLIDLYDARVGGGYEPPPEPREPCEGDACSHPPDPPQAPTPGSAGFQGPEGLPPASRSCRGPARRAKRLSKRAKRLRRAAKRSSAPKRTRQLRRRTKGTAKRARRLSAKAKRCRKARRAQARRARR